MTKQGSGVDIEKIKQLDRKKHHKKHTHMPGVPSLKLDKVKDKVSKKMHKESGDNKEKLTLKKDNDSIEEKMKAEEDAEKSAHDKKIDDKKKEFSKNVKDIMKGIRQTPQDK